ncbi:MAG: DoxX family membrane protein [Flavobacterium sp.]|uniref:DoxX family protein n=1 Tax=Flavobacterium sp. TaxID=239 RepID=UPI00120EF7A3|nr:DoxX family membrane protein [Flavobacterium sp.]RZJ68216.1 MAG: DoxX family membrane protein [Flavobacterium sp.]
METENYSKLQNTARIILGVMMVIAGTSHLTFARIEFQAQVPNWVPMDTDLVVLLSGIAEIAFGLSLIFVKKYRKQIGWFGAALFVAVFPGNIAQYLNQYDAFGLNSDSLRFARLFFQPVLILWVLWSTGAWPRKM